MPKIYSLKRKCNCCKLNDTCQSYRVTTREIGDTPGCMSPTEHKSILAYDNIDASVTDYAEYLSRQTKLYMLGIKNGGISYDQWWRNTWNYGKLVPVK